MDSTRPEMILKNEKGVALVYVAMLIFALVGMVGLAVDAGHLYVVRGQLQTAADAAALAGAAALYKEPGSTEVLPLDWERARAAAQAFVSQNQTDGVALSTGSVEVGYWPPVSPDGPLSTVQTSSDQSAAVRVTVARAAGSNGGAVELFFMRVLDSALTNAPVISRPAVATAGPVGAVPRATLFPMALSKCMTDDIFSRPESEWPNPISINSPYGPGGPECFSGQWTSLDRNTPSADSIRDIMREGNQTPLAIGDPIFIQPGTEGSLYQADRWPTPLPTGGMDVVLAIVDSEGTDLKTSGEILPITGFATFHIDDAVVQGPDKYITGHFVSYSQTMPAGTSIGGTPTNVVTPPLLVR